jgi:dihydrofolate reductase
VITRQQDYSVVGAQVVTSLEDALELSKENGEKEAFIIGGGEIYRMGLSLANKIYLTEIDGAFDGQVTFPSFSKLDWKEESRVHHKVDDRHKFSFDFVTYIKK